MATTTITLDDDVKRETTEILNSIEEVIDGCEDLVGTFRRVVLKYA